jgi:hypothetical protein
MFWQYRPEYLSFEAPGYNLVAPDGEPTARFAAAAGAIRQIEGLAGHLPLECPRAEVGVVYHPESQDLFLMGGEGARFLADLRGVYRTLWLHGIPADVLTPRMDWSPYRVLFLPNVALVDEATRERIERTLRESPETRLVAEGSFGLYSAEGQTSYRPPEGFAERFGVRLADVSRVTERDLATGGATLTTPYGGAPLVSPCGYAVLEPQGETRAIGTLRRAGPGGAEETVAVQTADGRFTWLGLTLSAGFGDAGHPGTVLGLVGAAGVRPPVAVEGLEGEGPGVVPVARRSRRGGWLLFLFNLGSGPARPTLRPRWPVLGVHDLLTGRPVPVAGGAFSVALPAWETAVLHCATE